MMVLLSATWLSWQYVTVGNVLPGQPRDAMLLRYVPAQVLDRYGTVQAPYHTV